MILHAQRQRSNQKLAISHALSRGKFLDPCPERWSVLSAAARMMPPAMWQQCVEGLHVMQGISKDSAFVPMQLLSCHIVTGVSRDAQTRPCSVMRLAHDWDKLTLDFTSWHGCTKKESLCIQSCFGDLWMCFVAPDPKGGSKVPPADVCEFKIWPAYTVDGVSGRWTECCNFWASSLNITSLNNLTEQMVTPESSCVRTSILAAKSGSSFVVRSLRNSGEQSQACVLNYCVKMWFQFQQQQTNHLRVASGVIILL